MRDTSIEDTLQRGQNKMQKTSADKKTDIYLKAYYGGYISKEAGFMQDIYKGWQGMKPQHKKWIGAGVGGIGAGLAGAIGGKMMGAKNTPLIALLTALAGGYGGWQAGSGKNDYISKLLAYLSGSKPKPVAPSGKNPLTTPGPNNTPAPGPIPRDTSIPLAKLPKAKPADTSIPAPTPKELTDKTINQDNDAAYTKEYDIGKKVNGID